MTTAASSRIRKIFATPEPITTTPPGIIESARRAADLFSPTYRICRDASVHGDDAVLSICEFTNRRLRLGGKRVARRKSKA